MRTRFCWLVVVLFLLGVTNVAAQSLFATRKAAQAGDPIAQNEMGMRYYYGDQVTQSFNDARLWFEKAANQSYPDAQFNLAMMYDHGDGVKVDYQLARKWYQKAAEQNFYPALRMLGMMYYYALGVPQDIPLAMRLINSATGMKEQQELALLSSYQVH